MIDTSALVAGLVADHVHHDVARVELRGGVRIPAIVMAETFSVLRRAFGQTATEAESLLHPWSADVNAVLPTTADAVLVTFGRLQSSTWAAASMTPWWPRSASSTTFPW